MKKTKHFVVANFNANTSFVLIIFKILTRLDSSLLQPRTTLKLDNVIISFPKWDMLEKTDQLCTDKHIVQAIFKGSLDICILSTWFRGSYFSCQSNPSQIFWSLKFFFRELNWIHFWMIGSWRGSFSNYGVEEKRKKKKENEDAENLKERKTHFIEKWPHQPFFVAVSVDLKFCHQRTAWRSLSRYGRSQRSGVRVLNSGLLCFAISISRRFQEIGDRKLRILLW